MTCTNFGPYLSQTLTTLHKISRAGVYGICVLYQNETIFSGLKRLPNHRMSAENQKGVNAVQWCSIENQKGVIAVDFVQRERPSNGYSMEPHRSCSNSLNWRYCWLRPRRALSILKGVLLTELDIGRYCWHSVYGDNTLCGSQQNIVELWYRNTLVDFNWWNVLVYVCSRNLHWLFFVLSALIFAT